jgi:hypothetical protein
MLTVACHTLYRMPARACQSLAFFAECPQEPARSWRYWTSYHIAFQDLTLCPECSREPARSLQSLLYVRRHMLDFHILYRRTSPLKRFYSRLRIRDVPALSLGPKSNYTDWVHTVFLGWQPCEVGDINRRFRDGVHLQHQTYDMNWNSACSDVSRDAGRPVSRILTMQVASLSVFHCFFASCLTSFLFSIHFSSLSPFFVISFIFSLLVFASFPLSFVFLPFCFSTLFQLINSIWNREELSEEWKESVVVLIYKNGDK